MWLNPRYSPDTLESIFESQALCPQRSALIPPGAQQCWVLGSHWSSLKPTSPRLSLVPSYPAGGSLPSLSSLDFLSGGDQLSAHPPFFPLSFLGRGLQFCLEQTQAHSSNISSPLYILGGAVAGKIKANVLAKRNQRPKGNSEMEFAGQPRNWQRGTGVRVS